MPRKITWIAAATILMAFAGLAVAQLMPPGSSQVKRLEYRLSDYQRFTGSGLQILALSPDGSKLAFATQNGLYLCSGEPLTATFISGTQGITAQPFFSPDGKWIGYWSLSEGQLKRVEAAGGVTTTLRGVSYVMGAHWFSVNSIAYGMATGGIIEISARKGPGSTIVSGGMEGAVYPQVLPDGRSVLYTAIVSNKAHIAVKPLKTTQERKLLFEGSAASYITSGHIIYRSLSNIVSAVPFDLKRLEVTGAPVPIFPGILGPEKAAQYAVSETGALAYIPDYTVNPQHRTLVWVTREGKEEPISALPDVYSSPRISPDGKHIALTVMSNGKRDICIWDLARALMKRLTSDEADDSGPLWSPDGRRVVYRTAGRESGVDVYAKAADAGGEAEKIRSLPNRNYLIYWLKEGRELAMRPFQGSSGEELPQISPDGRWLAYASEESGRSEIYVRPFPDVNRGRWLVSAQGGTCPLWSPDGRELYYRDAESVIAVPIEAGKAFTAGNPTALFWNPDLSAGTDRSSPPGWDINPVDKRFLMLKTAQPVRKVILLTNWLDRLK